MRQTEPMTQYPRLALFLGAVVALVIVLVVFDVPRLLTFESLKASLGSLREWRDESPLRFAAVFFGAYVLLTALSVPEAALLTLLAGALFGLTWGVVLVSFASSLGALGAFLISRHLARDAVQRRFGTRLKAMNDGVARDGVSYLFTLRLVPIVPFFLINLLMGLTPMSPLTFYAVSQAGMLPGTILYVNAGTRLASIDSPAGIVSPAVLFSFALLGLFPWLAKRGLESWKRRALYGRFKRPQRFERNLVVIGGGAAGLVSAYIGAAVKASVSLVESSKMGGDCLNYGCVPSKALIKSAKVAHQMRHADRYGLGPHEPLDSFPQVIARIQSVIRAIEPHDSVSRYTSLGVDVVSGHARIVDPWTVDVWLADGRVRRLTTRSIVIAAGASPVVPPLPGLDEAGFVTTDTMWDHFATMDSAPRRVVLLGGGPIGCELAQALARLGSAVTVVEMGERLLLREDSEVSDLARSALESDGVAVRTGHKALRCENQAGEKTLVAESQGASHRFPFDVLICAIGRNARLKGYGLEELGIETDRTIVTNEYLETLYPNILAAGDVAGPYQFTHTAAHQAWYAAVNALFGGFRAFKADYRVIPWTTFIDPEIARVGLSEAEARERGVAYEVARYPLSELDRAITDAATQGFVKVLTPPGKDRILGVTIVAEHAGDLLAEFVLAMKWGIGLEKILGTIHAYPTLAEASKYAAGEWKRAHAPQRLLSLLKRFHRWRLN
jgi:pyruvate/2-oxoglutarate dehydrogenase complex dihydrolipoamide dehydrogenase (E3) component/uncharacterized membrane protein YdjX (TVP38/TMEM64 family)